MQVLTVTALPIYLPVDTAQVPFGDPLSDISVTAAAPGVVTSPGYSPTNGDAVAFSFAAGGSIPGGLAVAQTYYVVSAANNTFSVSATKGGAAITTTSTGSLLTLHLLSQQKYGTTQPFKPGASCVAFNASASPVTLQGASDSNSGFSSAGVPNYGNPKGPGAFTTIATIAAGAAQVVNLNFDWIQLSAAGSLVLLQN